MNNNNHFMAFNSNQFPVWSTIKKNNILVKDSWIYYFLPKISCVFVETRRYWDTNSVIVNLYLKQQKFDCKILQFFFVVLNVCCSCITSQWIKIITHTKNLAHTLTKY